MLLLIGLLQAPESKQDDEKEPCSNQDRERRKDHASPVICVFDSMVQQRTNTKRDEKQRYDDGANTGYALRFRPFVHESEL